MPETVRIVRPHELTSEEFTAVQSLIAEGGEVDRTRLETLLKSCHWIALIERKGQLVCTAAIKPARNNYMNSVSRKSGYTLDAGTFVGEFGYVVTDPPYRRQGWRPKYQRTCWKRRKATCTRPRGTTIPGFTRSCGEMGSPRLDCKWQSVQHPGSSVVLWIRLA